MKKFLSFLALITAFIAFTGTVGAAEDQPTGFDIQVLNSVDVAYDIGSATAAVTPYIDVVPILLEYGIKENGLVYKSPVNIKKKKENVARDSLKVYKEPVKKNIHNSKFRVTPHKQ